MSENDNRQQSEEAQRFKKGLGAVFAAPKSDVERIMKEAKIQRRDSSENQKSPRQDK